MPKTSTPEKPRFKSEEAEWYHSKAGRAHATRMVQKAIRKEKLVVNEKLSTREAAELARKTGKVLILRNGSNVKPTDPAVLEKLVAEARASMTQAISIRLPVGDIEAAKRIAEKTGIGYQTVLKEIIHKGLEGAS